MVTNRTSGYLIRQRERVISRGCCCADCAGLSGTWGEVWLEDEPDYFDMHINPTCRRALVWNDLRWTEGATSLWIGAPSGQDFTLRLAMHNSGTGGNRRCWYIMRRRTEFPVVSQCWDYNPCTGAGNFDGWTGFAPGDEEALFPENLRAWLDARAGQRLVVGLELDLHHYADRDNTGVIPDTYGPFDNFYGLAGIKWSLSMFVPSDQHAAIIDAATLTEVRADQCPQTDYTEAPCVSCTNP